MPINKVDDRLVADLRRLAKHRETSAAIHILTMVSLAALADRRGTDEELGDVIGALAFALSIGDKHVRQDTIEPSSFAELGKLRQFIAAAEGPAVREARANGFSTGEIAEALGRSPQAIWKKYGKGPTVKPKGRTGRTKGPRR